MSNTMITEALSEAMRLHTEGTSYTKYQLSIFHRMIGRVVDGAVRSLTKRSLVHLPHCSGIIGKSIVGPTLILL
jgi:hypothetical protein